MPVKVKKVGTREEWIKLGNLLKACKYLVLEAELLSDKIMTRRECYQLNYASDRLHAFIDNAEEIMWKQLPAMHDISIVYGLYDLEALENPYLIEAQNFEKEDAMLPMEKQCPDFTEHLYEESQVCQDGINLVLKKLGLDEIKIPEWGDYNASKD